MQDPTRVPEPGRGATIARFAALLAELSDLETLTARLCEASRRMVEADGVAMTLSYLSENRLMVYVSNDRAAALDDLQDVVGEGPSFEAARSGQVEVARFGEEDDGTWALLRERMTTVGFSGAMIAVPLHAASPDLAVLTLHRERPIDEEDVSTINLIGAAVGTALLEHPERVAHQEIFADAWDARALVHQATGMVVAQIGVPPDDALALLRAQAFSRSLPLVEIAREIIDRDINFRDFTIEGD